MLFRNLIIIASQQNFYSHFLLIICPSEILPVELYFYDSKKTIINWRRNLFGKFHTPLQMVQVWVAILLKIPYFQCQFKKAKNRYTLT